MANIDRIRIDRLSVHHTMGMHIDECWKASKEWQLAGWRSQPIGYHGVHYVFESRVV